MAMGIVSDNDFDSELKKSEKSKSAIVPISPIIPDFTPIESIHEPGRGKNNVATPDSLRKLIGQTVVESGRSEALTLAKSFGVSPSSVSAYSRGARSTATYDERPDRTGIIEVKEKIAKKARNKLVLALNHLTPSKMSEAKPRELAGIAKDMSFISKNMEETLEDPNKNKAPGPTFVFYSPKLMKEEELEVVQAKE